MKAYTTFLERVMSHFKPHPIIVCVLYRLVLQFARVFTVHLYDAMIINKIQDINNLKIDRTPFRYL